MSTDPTNIIAPNFSISTSPPKTLDHDSVVNSSTGADPSPDTNPKIEDAAEQVGEGEFDEEEGEGECGFCVFMKGGGCKETFVAWEECVALAERGKEDLAEKCFEVTSMLRKCMEANAEYYEPLLRAEKEAEEVAIVEVEREMAGIEEKVLEVDGASSSGKPDAA